MKDRKLMQLAVAAAPNPSAAPNAGAGATGAAGQGAAVRDLLQAAGFRAVRTRRDLAGLERATQGARGD